jgi:aromatic-amino-acid transaminase
MNLFSSVQLAPKDPIFGLTEAYVADQNPEKVNLGVGVYYTDDGKVPLLKAVIEAEKEIVAKQSPRSYIPIEGPSPYNMGVQKLLFGEDSPLIKDGRVVTAECLGGTGALRVGGDFVRRIEPNVPAAISNPSWENHRGVFEAAGYEVLEYTYFDSKTRGVDFAGMVKSLESFPKRTLVVLHVCCHNPTGADLNKEQWLKVIEICRERDLIPFLDMAYQGFAQGIEEDGLAARLFAESGMSFFVSSSFSKSFSLYGERVGALSIVTQNRDESARVLSQLKRVIRTNYSNPPTHGGAIVAAVLNNPAYVSSGKTSSHTCVIALKPCAMNWLSAWPPTVQNRILVLSSRNVACSPIRDLLQNKWHACKRRTVFSPCPRVVFALQP